MAEKRLNMKITQTGAENVSASLGNIDNSVSSLIKRYLSWTAVLYGAKKAFDFTVGAAIANEKGIRVLQTSVELLGIKYDKVRGQIEGMAAQMEATTEYGDTDTRRVLAILIQLTGDYEKSMKNLPLVMDMASSGLFDLDSAARYVAMALEGNVMMLSRYIPALKAENNEIIRNGTAAQKAAEAMRILLEKFGGTAQKNLQSTSAQIKQFNNYISDMGKKIGIVLLPAINRLFESLTHLKAVQAGAGILAVYSKAMARLNELEDAFYAKKGHSQLQMETFNNELFETHTSLVGLLESYQKGGVTLEQFNRYATAHLDILEKLTKTYRDVKVGAENTIAGTEKAIAEIIDDLYNPFSNEEPILPGPDEEDWQRFEERYQQQAEMQAILRQNIELEKQWAEIPPPSLPANYNKQLLEAKNLMQNFTDTLGQAVVYGRSLGDAVVASLKAIAAEMISKMIIYALFYIFTGGQGTGGQGINIASMLSNGKSNSFWSYLFGGSYSNGGDFVATRPQLISVGERGAERVTVQPLGRSNQGKSITVNIYGDYWTDDILRNRVIPDINRAIARGGISLA